MIKVQVYTIYLKFRHSNGNTDLISFIPHVLLISPQHSCFQSSEFKNTLLYQNEGEETYLPEHQPPCPVLLKFHHCSPPFSKNHSKKLRPSMWDTYIDQSNFPHADAQNIQCLVYELWTRQNTLFKEVAFKFVVKTIIHHYYCRLVESFIW